jgi:hypothetical protein
MHRASAAVEGAGASRILPVVARGSLSEGPECGGIL